MLVTSLPRSWKTSLLAPERPVRVIGRAAHVAGSQSTSICSIFGTPTSHHNAPAAAIAAVMMQAVL
jgi:hypothetical protein